MVDAFFFSLMVGAGESYLPAYGLTVGMSEWLTGLFATVPLIAGAVIQLISPWGLQKVGSVKRWVVGSALVQATAFLPLLYFSIYPTDNFLWLFLVAAIYWGAGFAAGPSWNYWMGELVTAEQSAQYFARRHRMVQLGILIGLVGGGLALHWKIHVGPFTSVFSFLFLVAFVARASSSFFLWLKIDAGKNVQIVKTNPGKFLSPQYRSFFTFLFIFYVTIFISSPFVSPFFLEKLHLNYDQYMLGLGSLFIAKIAILPWASKLIERFGVEKVFFIGALGISPLPILWQLNSEMWFVVALQMLSGVFWGIFEVGLNLIFFKNIRSEDKVQILTTYNLFNSTAIILGSLIGGQILKMLEARLEGYFMIFTLGAALRTLVVIFYWTRVRPSKNSSSFGADPYLDKDLRVDSSHSVSIPKTTLG